MCPVQSVTNVPVHSVCIPWAKRSGKEFDDQDLLGMMHPTSGSGSILGHLIDRERESFLIRQRVAFVAEDKRLYEYMTVGQLIGFTKSFFSRWDGTLEGRLLEQFELPRERNVRQLSKGMRTKLALLLGFARGCDLLILDEPTEGLDPAAIEDVLQIVVSLAAQGTTIFFSWHQIAEVEQGVVVITFGLLLSEIFEGEFTSPVVGLCALTAIFLAYRAHTLRGWNVFDVMSATTSIERETQLLSGGFHWFGMVMCLLMSSCLLLAAHAVIRARDF